MSETVNATIKPIDSDHHSKIALIVLVPVLFILIVVCIILTVFVYLSIKKREQKQLRQYRPVATKDDGTTGRVNTLPYPPSVKISKNAYPHLEYSLATQLPQPLEVSTARYPFIQHQLPGPQGSIHERRPPRFRTKRRGNHKHGKGKHVVLGHQDTAMDSDHSPTPEPETNFGAKICQIQVKRDSSPEETSTGTKPEITLVLKYDEVESQLRVKIGHVVNLPLREDGTEVDGYVRMHFTPALSISMDVSTTKTRTRRKSSSPVFEEEMMYSNVKREQLLELTLHIEVMDYKSYGKHAVLVETQIELKNVKFFDGNCRLTLPLEPPKSMGECNGVVFLSLCFDVNNKKLSVIILRAKDLNDGNADETDPLAKITISVNDRTVTKLKTKKKPGSSSPIFNEAISCVADRSNINDIQVVVTLLNDRKHSKTRELGKVVLGSKSTGNELRHWNDAISSPGKHIAEWHDLVNTQTS